MAIINVTLQEDRDKLEQHALELAKIAQLKGEIAFLNNRIAMRQAELSDRQTEGLAFGVKVRAALVRLKPALDGILEDPLTNLSVVRDENDVIIQVLTNADVP